MSDKEQAAKTEAEATAILRAGTALASPQKNPHTEGDAYALVPDGANVEYLQRPTLPFRKSGTVKLSDAASLLEYWKRQAAGAQSYLYGSMSPAQFVAVFNDHSTGEKAGWRDHRAVYTLEHSKEWLMWTGHSKKDFSGNESFAIWLEENLLDVVSPDPALMMDVALNIKVNQSQGFSKAVRLSDGNIEMSYSNVIDGQVASGAGKNVKIPELFVISIPVWSGLSAKKYEIEARFRYRLQSGGVTLRFELVRPHKAMEEAFKDVFDQIETGAATKVLWGTAE